MSTRALVDVKNKFRDKMSIVTIYKHCDGYIEELGAKIQRFTKNKTIVSAQGDMGCFAASLVANLKKKKGDVYLEIPGTKNIGEEFRYVLYSGKANNKGISDIMIAVIDCMDKKVLYKGMVSKWKIE